MKEVLGDYYANYLEDNLPDNANEAIERYSRKALSRQFAELLDKQN